MKPRRYSRMETGFGEKSIRCHKGRHGECSGEPPSEEMKRFLPYALRDRGCGCECHRKARRSVS